MTPTNLSGLIERGGSKRRLSEVTLDKLMERAFPEPNSGCWLWTGYVSKNGYGTFNDRKAHRLLYEMVNGPVPPGKVLDHLCRVRSCVNPGHLEPVSMRTNVIRGVGVTAMNAKQTVCTRGHPLTGENVKERIRSGNVTRSCVLCLRMHDAAYRDRRRARKVQVALLALQSEVSNV